MTSGASIMDDKKPPQHRRNDDDDDDNHCPCFHATAQRKSSRHGSGSSASASVAIPKRKRWNRRPCILLIGMVGFLLVHFASLRRMFLSTFLMAVVDPNNDLNDNNNSQDAYDEEPARNEKTHQYYHQHLQETKSSLSSSLGRHSMFAERTNQSSSTSTTTPWIHLYSYLHWDQSGSDLLLDMLKAHAFVYRMNENNNKNKYNIIYAGACLHPRTTRQRQRATQHEHERRLQAHVELLHTVGLQDVIPIHNFTCPPSWTVQTSRGRLKNAMEISSTATTAAASATSFVMHDNIFIKDDKDAKDSLWTDSYFHHVRSLLQYSTPPITRLYTLRGKKRSNNNNNNAIQKVAVHVQRGHVRPCSSTTHSQQYLSNAYFLSLLDSTILTDPSKQYHVTIYSQPQHNNNTVETLNVFRARNYTIVLQNDIDNDFDEYNDEAAPTAAQVWQDLVHADVLVASRSSFSILAALFHRNLMSSDNTNNNNDNTNNNRGAAVVHVPDKVLGGKLFAGWKLAPANVRKIAAQELVKHVKQHCPDQLAEHQGLVLQVTDQIPEDDAPQDKTSMRKTSSTPLSSSADYLEEEEAEASADVQGALSTIQVYSYLRYDRSGSVLLDMLKAHAYAYRHNLTYAGACMNPSKPVRTERMQVHVELLHAVGLQDVIPILNYPCPPSWKPVGSHVNLQQAVNKLQRQQEGASLIMRDKIYGGSKSQDIFWTDEYLNHVRSLVHYPPSRNDDSNDNNNNVKTVAVHVRRGDIRPCNVFSQRYLSNSYFVSLLDSSILTDPSTQYQVTIYSERNTFESLDVFRQRNYTMVLDNDEPLVKVWQDFITADVFVASMSSFSMIPALLNRNLLRPPKSQRHGAAAAASNSDDDHATVVYVSEPVPGGHYPTGWKLAPIEARQIAAQELLAHVEERCPDRVAEHRVAVL